MPQLLRPHIETPEIDPFTLVPVEANNNSNDEYLQHVTDLTTPSPAELICIDDDDDSDDIIFEGFHKRQFRHPRKAHKNVSFASLLQTFISLSMITSITATTIASVQCSKGGLTITPGLNDSHITVCSGSDFCITHTGNETFLANIPPLLTLNPYELLIRIASNQSNTKVFTTKCPAAPFCETINCIFCAALMSNPTCWPRMAFTTTALYIWLTLFLTTAVGILALRIWSKIKSLLLFILVTLWLVISRCLPSRTINKLTKRPAKISLKGWKPSRTAIRLATILTLVHTTLSCNAITLSSSVINHCTDSSCHDTREVQMSFDHLHLESCVAINNSSTYDKIEILSVRLTCARNTLFFTKPTSTHFRSKKRCPAMGSCVGDYCQQVKHEDEIPELHLVNQYPGKTYCLDSCGFLSCGCGLPSEGCLFYRIYQKPQNKLYEVFECTQWLPTVKFRVSSTRTNDSEVVITQPQTTFPLSLFNITITQLSHNSDIQLNKRFIAELQEPYRVTFLPDDTKFTYTCSSLTNCTVNDQCSCHTSSDQINCDCLQNNVTSLFTEQSTFPTIRPSGSYHTHPKNQDPYFLPYTHSAQILLTFNMSNLQIQDDDNFFAVSMNASLLSGCYHCAHGAQATIICTSETNRAVLLTCPDQQFMIHCDPFNH
ncbi:unnamed protein product, partial [Auanema sp. JU1783]